MLSNSNKRITHPALALFLLVLIVIGLTISAYADGITTPITLDVKTNLEGHAASGLAASYVWEDGLGPNNNMGNEDYGLYANVTIEDNNTLLCEASGYYFDSSDSSYTTLTLTLANTSELPKTLSFTLTEGDVCNQVTVTGATLVNGVYSAELAENGGYCSITLVTTVPATSAGEINSFTLSNITLVSEDDTSIKVTFANPTDGSGTTSLAGKTATFTGDSISDCNGEALTVVPASGYTFIGWKSTDGTMLTNNGTISPIPKPDTSMTIYPYFVPTDAPFFGVGTNRYYYWQEAFADAKASGNTVIVLKGGTLTNDPSKTVLGSYVTSSNGTVTYTIPSGVKFLIPYSATDTGAFASGNALTNIAAADESASKIKTYLTLDVAVGAKMVCNGIMNVNGQRDEKNQTYTGGPAGNHGMLRLNAPFDPENPEAQLTVNGTLYCYGFIAGTGLTEINNGGKLHEFLQICDFAGGNNTRAWKTAAGYYNPEVFMVTQYYVQNVEAPLKVDYGATAYVETAVYASELFLNSSPLIGNGEGMFHLVSGTYALRTYDSATDRCTYKLGGSGTVTFGSLKISLKVSGISIDMNSKDHVLPINNAMTVRIGSGITVNMGNAVAILPGGEVIVEEGATVNLTKPVYIFDKGDWSSTYVFSGSAACRAPAYTVGRGTAAKLAISSSGRLEINGTLNVKSGGALYTTSDSKNSDKIVYGIGTIVHSGTTGTSTLYVGYTSKDYLVYAKINNTEKVATSYAYLAGLTTGGTNFNQFSSGQTYKGVVVNGVNYWYINSSHQDATCTAAGYDRYWCTDSTKYLEVTIAKLPHTPGTAATCTTAQTCTVCGATLVEALEHTWGEVGYTWSDDNTSCTATRTCSKNTTDACVETATATEITSEETDATCVAKGFTTYTATFEATWAESQEKKVDGDPATGIHTDTNGDLVCSGCQSKLFKLLTMNVAADARTELVLKFEVHKDLYDAAEADEKQAYENVVLVNFDNSKDTNATHTIDLEEETTDAGTKYYVIVTQPVASGLMTENVTVTFSDGDNSVYVLGTGDSSVSRNVVDYARAVLLSEGTSDAAKKLVAAMVNYGGYAQQFFALKNSTEPGTLASDLLSETGINAPEISAEKSLTSIDGTLVSGDLTVTQDPGLDAAISQRIFFALSNGASFTSESTTQVSVTLTYKRTRNGEEYTKTLYPKQENDGRYSVEILNIPAAFLDFGYKIEGVYYNSNGEEKTFVVYPSIASYMSRVYKNEGFTTTNKSDDADLAEARKNLMEAMWLYNQAAYDFFYPSNESEGS